jgi:single-stranded-DNA-specific exonuclease
MRWILPEDNIGGDLISRILKSRGIDDTTKFLKPDVSHIHNALFLHDAEKAANKIIQAVKDKKKIFIHGDFDVDGVTATTILWRFLYYDLGANVTPYIPDRFSEGYGLSDDSISNIIDQGADLIITVDCGVKDIPIVSKYVSKVDFIITDHHTITDSEDVSSELNINNDYRIIGKFAVSNKALAVVHPRLNDYPFPDICGATVSWKLACAINEVGKYDFDMHKYIDLVALGTVCDVMPLLDENRAIVKLGLEQMSSSSNQGLLRLLEASGVDRKDISTRSLGFAIGPRINAAGRMSHAITAVRLLSTESSALSEKLATELSKLNLERQEVTQELLEVAHEQAKEQKENKILFIHGESWPEGIIGLIAGRLSQHYYRPVIVGSSHGEIVKASARSVPGFDISNALRNSSALLVRFGGHNQAAGLQVHKDMINKFIKSINSFAEDVLTDELLIPSISVDVLCSTDEIDMEIAKRIIELEPFGESNLAPNVLLQNITPEWIQVFGRDKNFIKFFDKANKRIQMISFTDASKYMKIFSSNRIVDVIGNIEINKWNGNEEVRLRIIDIQPSK